jgi:hypothetical protein
MMIALLTAVSLLAPTHPKEIPRYEALTREDVTDVVASSARWLSYVQASQVAVAVIRAGKKHDVHPAFLLAMGYTESRWKWWISHMDAGSYSYGFAQFKLVLANSPRHRKRAGYPCKPLGCRPVDLLQLQKNTELLAFIIRYYGDKYGARATVCYNCGVGCCRKTKATPATRGYWRRWRKFKAAL